MLQELTPFILDDENHDIRLKMLHLSYINMVWRINGDPISAEVFETDEFEFQPLVINWCLLKLFFT